MRRHFSIWKTTLLGGVIFLLPFAVIVFLFGQLGQIVYSLAGQIRAAGVQWTVGGASLAVLAAIVVLVLLCYAAGLVARVSFGRRFNEKVERNLLLLFPRYAIWKNQLTSNIGPDGGEASLQPVLVSFDQLARIGFEVERTVGADGIVTVYLPGAPDPWAGRVVHVDAARVKPLQANFGEAAAVCESLGRGAGALLTAQPTTATTAAPT